MSLLQYSLEPDCHGDLDISVTGVSGLSLFLLRVTRQLIDQRGSDSENKEDLDKTPLDSEQVQGLEESIKGGNRCEKGSNIHIDVAVSSRKQKHAKKLTSMATNTLMSVCPLVAKKRISKKKMPVQTSVETNMFTLASPVVKFCAIATTRAVGQWRRMASAPSSKC